MMLKILVLMTALLATTTADDSDTKPQYTFGKNGQVGCPAGYIQITDQSKCETEATTFFDKEKEDAGCKDFGVKGCVYRWPEGGIFFNTCLKRTTNYNHRPVCELMKPVSDLLLGEGGQSRCPSGFKLVTDEARCKKAATDDFKMLDIGKRCWWFWEKGCAYRPEGIFFNVCGKERHTFRTYRPICQKTSEKPKEEKFKLGKNRETDCPSGYTLVTSAKECGEEATDYFEKPRSRRDCWSFAGRGCAYGPTGIFFDNCDHKKVEKAYRPICKKKVIADSCCMIGGQYMCTSYCAYQDAPVPKRLRLEGPLLKEVKEYENLDEPEDL